MKKIIIVNGTMGAGKSTICERLLKDIEYSVWLDGDWCWKMNPWDFSDENKKMVIDNISYILNNYLSNSMFQYIIFSWVLNKNEILDLLLNRLNKEKYELILFTITCSEENLIKRLKERGDKEEVIELSISRLKDYDNMQTIKIYSDNDIIVNVRKMKEILTNL